MADACSGFESQNYLKDRCRKCFRQKDRADALPQKCAKALKATSLDNSKKWKGILISYLTH
ncbi:unnamed protein product [Heligmosomoides polygyrus]|uniref:Nuclear receptor domain-containing protein n=1 Tax=Heligmosomoides polygyrus TaxID=6339 RepID=A0A183FEK2_HELPZ|nr:unnamed protein product [Heligmosomoides polygyrus]